jgi:hypothetical protein
MFKTYVDESWAHVNNSVVSEVGHENDSAAVTRIVLGPFNLHVTTLAVPVGQISVDVSVRIVRGVDLNLNIST